MLISWGRAYVMRSWCSCLLESNQIYHHFYNYLDQRARATLVKGQNWSLLV